MLFDWAISVSILLSIILAAFVASFLLDNIFTFKTNRHPSDDPVTEALYTARVERKLLAKKLNQQVAIVYLNQIFNSILEIFSKIFELPSIFTYAITVVWQNRTVIIVTAIVSSIAFATFENGPLVLEKLDGFYSCAITPFVNNILFSILHILNLLWAAFIPIYNIFVIMSRQLYTGTVFITTKCATSSFSIVRLQKDFVNLCITIFDEILNFTGLNDMNFGESNMFFNPFNIYPIVEKFRIMFYFIPNTFVCLCKATSDWSNSIFYGSILSDRIDWILHHLLNLLLSFAQTFLQIIPPFLNYPSFENTFYHFIAGIWELCKLYDEWMFVVINTILNTTNVGGGIVIETPKVFFFETISHLYAAPISVFETMIDAGSHIILPFDTIPITNTKFMANLFKIDDAFTHLSLFTHSLAHLISWMLKVLMELLVSAVFTNRCQVIGQTYGITNTSCARYMSGQCSVSCLDENTIQINDINFQCLFQSNAKNKYDGQSSVFNTIIEDVSARLTNEADFYSTNQFLPVEDKRIFMQYNKIDTLITFSIHYDDLFLREQMIVDKCGPTYSFVSQREKKRNCYKDVVKNELRTAYGAVGGPDLNTMVACMLESVILAPLKTLQIAYNFYVDYFWFNFIGYFKGEINGYNEYNTKKRKNREDFRGLLRAYSGPWFSRDSPPMSSMNFNLTVDKNHFYNALEYKNFIKGNDDTAGQVNLNEHVLYHFDRIGYYFFSTFERETFGKILFNVYRLAIEQIRIIVRLEAEGYGLSSDRRTIFVNGSTVSPDGNADNTEVYPHLFRTEIGCLYNYGNISNVDRGFCSSGSVIENAPQCDVYDQTLTYSTSCRCIEDPGFHNGDYNLMEKENIHFYTTKAISKWCSINFWEFNFIFLARAFNGVRNFITALSLGNLKQGFPPPDNVCDTAAFQYTQTSTISTVFGQTCSILAYKDFMCPAGELLQRVYLTISRLLRKEFRNFLILFSGFGVDRMNLQIADNVCDAQNALMSFSNMVSALLLSQDINLQKPFTKLLFSLINVISIPLEWGVLGLRTTRAFITGDPNIIDTGNANGFQTIKISTLRNIILKLLQKFVMILTRHLLEVLNGFSQLLDSLAPCRGAICASDVMKPFRIIVEIVEILANDLVLPTMLDLLELGMRVIQLIVEPSSITAAGLESLILKMFNVIGSVFRALVSNVSVWLSFLMNTLLGPIGDIIKAVQSAICSVLGFVNELGANMDTSFCNARRLNEKPMFRRKLLSNTSVLFDVANDFKWDDNTRCDQIMRAYQDYDIDKMIPLEKIEWLECLHLRFLSEILEENFQVGIPKDIFYNWLRKFTVAYDVTASSLIYLSWYFSKNPTLSDLKIRLENYGYNPNYVLNAKKHLTNLFNELFSWKHLKQSMEEMLNAEGDERGTRVYTNIRKLHSQITETEWTASMLKTKKMILKFYNKIELDKNIVNKDVHIFSETVRDFIQIQEKMDSSIFGQVYGAFTNLECPADSILCVNCALLDNFLYNGITQIQAASKFYKEDFVDVIVPEFEAYWENVSAYNARYTKAYKKATEDTSKQQYGGTLEVNLPLSTLVGGIFNGEHNIQDLVNGISYFLQGNYSGKIPPDAKIVFSNDLQYYLELPFKVGCDEADWKWKSYKENVGDGFFAVLILFVILEAFRLFIGEFNILFTLTLYSTALVVAQFLFLYNTYGYNPTCTPIMPAYLWHDILWWSDEYIWLDCACSYVPYLSIEPCVEQTCDTCELSTAFHECRDLLPAFNDLGYAYHFVFLFRWSFPDLFKYLGNLNTWPFPYIFSNDGFQKLLSDTERGLDVTGVESNCFYLHILTPISILVILYIIILMTIPLLNIVIKTVKESVSIFINAILVLYYLSQASGFSEAAN